MTSAPLRSALAHETRLDILGCLCQEPLTAADLGCRIGTDERRVAHHLSILEAFGLVEVADDAGEGEATLYAMRLQHQPAWVARAVVDHRRKRKSR